MTRTRALCLLSCIAVLTVAPASSALAAQGASPEQVAWVRRAAGKFVHAELAGSGASVCAVLYAPLRASSHGRSCEERWNARLARLLQRRGERALLRVQLRGIAHAGVEVRGSSATLALAHPLLGTSTRFVWSESCWMLRG